MYVPGKSAYHLLHTSGDATANVHKNIFKKSEDFFEFVLPTLLSFLEDVYLNFLIFLAKEAPFHCLITVLSKSFVMSLPPCCYQRYKYKPFVMSLPLFIRHPTSTDPCDVITSLLLSDIPEGGSGGATGPGAGGRETELLTDVAAGDAGGPGNLELALLCWLLVLELRVRRPP